MGGSRIGVTSQRSGTVSLSRARYGVLAELYIVLSRFSRSEKCSMCFRFRASGGRSQDSANLRVNLGRDVGDEAITERENKYNCSLQTLSAQKIISVNEVRQSRRQIFEE